MNTYLITYSVRSSDRCEQYIVYADTESQAREDFYKDHNPVECSITAVEVDV